MSAKMCDTPCETCEKEGLPLLLARYGIHTVESKAPELSGNLGGEPFSKISLGAHQQYGLRLLRSGYVYVYDEARKYRDEYFVTADGFLTKMPPRPKTGSRPAPAADFACARSGAAPMAAVITIRNPKHAKNIWISFSDVEWTEAIWKLHEDAAYRQRHMQKIVISDGKVVPQPHTVPLDQVDALMPEYKWESAAIDRHIKPWSPFQFNSRVAGSKALKDAAKKVRPQGGVAIVVLNDPVAIAAELDALMNYRLNHFASDPQRQRPLATSQAILQIEQAVRSQAVDREEEAAQEIANQMLGQPDIGMLFEGYRNRKIKQIEEVRTVTSAEAKKAEDNAWKPYTAYFNEKAMKDWLAQYEEELKKFDAEYIAPMAVAHRDWMKSHCMQEYFACNFDEEDIDHGIAHAITVSICLGSTQDKAACFDLYTEWLSASEFNKSNILLNAFALNQKKSKKELQKSAEVSLDWRGFSWDAMAGSLGEMYKAKWDLMAEVVGAHLVMRVMGPLAKIADISAASGRAKLSLVTVSVLAGKPYTVVDVVGGKKRFREMLVKQLIQLSGQPLNENKMQKAVADEIRRLKIAGVDLEGRSSKRFLVFLDEAYIKGMPPNLNANEKVRYVAGSLNTIEKMEALNMAHWRGKLGQPSAARIQGSYPYLVGLLGALFQYQAMNKLGEDEKKAMSHEKVEGRYRMYAGMAAFWGTVADLVGQGVERSAHFIPKAAKGLQFLGRSILSRGGRFLGIVGAGVVAYWDAKAGIKSFQEGRYGMVVLYGSSVVLGLSAAIVLTVFAASAWAGPVALVLVALLIAVSVLIEYFKDNKIQEWLKRCHWGVQNGNVEKYKSLADEMKELEKAVA